MHRASNPPLGSPIWWVGHSLSGADGEQWYGVFGARRRVEHKFISQQAKDSWEGNIENRQWACHSPIGYSSNFRFISSTLPKTHHLPSSTGHHTHLGPSCIPDSSCTKLLSFPNWACYFKFQSLHTCFSICAKYWSLSFFTHSLDIQKPACVKTKLFCTLLCLPHPQSTHMHAHSPWDLRPSSYPLLSWHMLTNITPLHPLHCNGSFVLSPLDCEFSVSRD